MAHPIRWKLKTIIRVILKFHFQLTSCNLIRERGIGQRTKYDYSRRISPLKFYIQSFVTRYPVWLWNRFLSAGFEPVLSQTEKLIMYSILLHTIFYEYQNKNNEIYNSFVNPGLQPLGPNKTCFNLIIFHLDIHGNLSIIRCAKYILFKG